MSSVLTDKICDQVSDAILDAHLKQDPDAKVACGKLQLMNQIISAIHSAKSAQTVNTRCMQFVASEK